MTRLIPAGCAAAAIVILAGTAQAAGNRVCQWTGSDWACGDGNMVTEHYSAGVGPNMQIQPAPSFVTPDGHPVPVGYARSNK